jgi:hypothetical protein
MGADYYEVTLLNSCHIVTLIGIDFSLTGSTNFNIGFLIGVLQTDADRRFLAAKGSVPIGIGKNSHIKRAIIDKNARIGDDVKVIYSLIRIFFRNHILSLLSKCIVLSFFHILLHIHAGRVREMGVYKTNFLIFNQSLHGKSFTHNLHLVSILRSLTVTMCKKLQGKLKVIS